MATITKRQTKRGIVYTAQIRRKGVSESKTFSNLARTRLWAAQREAELTDISEGVIPRHTLGEALERYSREVSPKKRGGRWEQIRLEAIPQVAECTLKTTLSLGSCSPALLALWRDRRSAEVSSGTVLRELGLLSAVFRQCVREWGWMRANPVGEIAKPPSPAHRDIVLSLAQIRKVLRSCGRTTHTISGRVGLAFLFALRTGMRAGEICSLKLNQVHGDHVSLPLTKNGTARSVPLSRKAQIVLQRALDGNRDPVFGVNVKSLDTLFRKARERAGLGDIHFHDTRHTFATRLAATMQEKGISFPEFIKIMGWSDPKYAMVYVNPTASDLAKKLDKRIKP